MFFLTGAFFLTAYHFAVHVFPDTVQPQPGDPVGKISNETLLAILALLVAFAGLLAYVFKHLVKNEIRTELKTMAEQERLASRAETNTAVAFAYWNLFHFPDGSGDVDDPVRRDKFGKFLDLALLRSHAAFQDMAELDKEEYDDIVSEITNDLAYYLADKVMDKPLALALEKQLWERVESGRIPKKVRRNPRIDWMKTCAWVLYRFSANDPDLLTKANKIVDDLRPSIADGKEYQKLRAKFKMPPTT